jgi:hypothetical protein
MNYVKPSFVLTANAAEEIQGSQDKWPFIFWVDANGSDYDALLPAYEADE